MMYQMHVERTATGYSAYWDKGGAYTVAENFAELKKNMVEVMNLALETDDIKYEDIKVIYDLPSFFDANKAINAAGLAAEIGMTKSLLSQYISGNKKASEAQTKRILEGIRSFGRKLADMDFAF